MEGSVHNTWDHNGTAADNADTSAVLWENGGNGNGDVTTPLVR